MRFARLPVMMAIVSVSVIAAAAATSSISAASLLARTRTLASDAFEGRGPGTPGEQKTVAYIEAEFRKLGLKPGNPNGTYIQETPLVGITSKPTLSFDVTGKPMPMVPIN